MPGHRDSRRDLTICVGMRGEAAGAGAEQHRTCSQEVVRAMGVWHHLRNLPPQVSISISILLLGVIDLYRRAMTEREAIDVSAKCQFRGECPAER